MFKIACQLFDSQSRIECHWDEGDLPFYCPIFLTGLQRDVLVLDDFPSYSSPLSPPGESRDPLKILNHCEISRHTPSRNHDSEGPTLICIFRVDRVDRVDTRKTSNTLVQHIRKLPRFYCKNLRFCSKVEFFRRWLQVLLS